jgi:hypothetical protein
MECDTVADTRKAISHFNQHVKLYHTLINMPYLCVLSTTSGHQILSKQIISKSAIKSIKTSMVFNISKVKLLRQFNSLESSFADFLLFGNTYFQGKTRLTK